ncbi:MAG: WecB/TagA/CpsF family glycosyltransferase [Chitinophagaceae bacterium]
MQLFKVYDQPLVNPAEPKPFAMDRLNVFSIPINIGTYNQFISTVIADAGLRKSYYTCVANVHMLVEAYRDRLFAKTVSNARVIAPDGRPLTWAIRMFYGISQDRVAGMDLLPDLLEVSQEKEISVYFYGGHPDMVAKTRIYLKMKYPHLKLAGFYSPPFKKLNEKEEALIVRDINASGAQIVFVSLGCPKQEKWMASMQHRVNGVMIGIGGALSVMVGVQKRAPKWVQTAGLEWSFRLFQEPTRLFTRYAKTNSTFIYLFIKSFFRRRFSLQDNNVIDFDPKIVPMLVSRVKDDKY